MKTFFKAKKIIFEGKVAFASCLVVEASRVVALCSNNDIPADALLVDYSDKIICPGFLDVHTHGIGGADVMDCTVEANQTMAQSFAKNGVTSYIATTLTASVDKVREAVRAVKDFTQSDLSNYQCAKIQGVFLEGPFFTRKHKGAQNPRYFLKPSASIVRDWQTAAGGLIKKVALAPELSGSIPFIYELKKMGIQVILGHSAATYEQANEALGAGAVGFLHTFNGMSPLHHKKPGMAGSALLSGNSKYCEVVCDSYHVHPSVVRLLFNTKGVNQTVLVSDSIRSATMPEGIYKLGEYDVHVKDGTARLDNGGLAGSILLIKDAVKNIYDWGVCSDVDAINMATIVAAKSAGIDDVCGILASGRIADFNVLDEDLNLVTTYLNGEKILN